MSAGDSGKGRRDHHIFQYWSCGVSREAMIGVMAAEYGQTTAYALIADARRPTIDEALHFSDALAAETTVGELGLQAVRLVGRALSWLPGHDRGGGICSASVADDNPRTPQQLSNRLARRIAEVTATDACVRQGV